MKSRSTARSSGPAEPPLDRSTVRRLATRPRLFAFTAVAFIAGALATGLAWVVAHSSSRELYFMPGPLGRAAVPRAVIQRLLPPAPGISNALIFQPFSFSASQRSTPSSSRSAARPLDRPAGFLTRAFGLSTSDEIAWGKANGLTEPIPFSHHLDEVFPPELFRSHPEFFPLVWGKRFDPTHRLVFWQPDLGREDVAHYAAEQAARFFTAHPEANTFSLGVNDGLFFGESPEMIAILRDHFPGRTVDRKPRLPESADRQSENSSTVRPLDRPSGLTYFRDRPDFSPLVFTFMNRAAADLARTYPDKYLGCLAYYWCENAPPFAVDPHVIPFLAADRSQSYDPAFVREEFDLQSRWAHALGAAPSVAPTGRGSVYPSFGGSELQNLRTSEPPIDRSTVRPLDRSPASDQPRTPPTSASQDFSISGFPRFSVSAHPSPARANEGSETPPSAEPPIDRTSVPPNPRTSELQIDRSTASADGPSETSSTGRPVDGSTDSDHRSTDRPFDLTSDRDFSASDFQRFSVSARAAPPAPAPRLGLYDYLDGFGFLVPRVPIHAFAANLRHAHAVGFTDYYGEANLNWALDGPLPWVLAQLLQNPEQNPDRLLDIYYSSYFEEAAGPMRQFFDRCEQQWMRQSAPVYWLKQYRNESQAALFPTAICQELRGLLDAAAAKASHDIVRRRVAFVADAFGVTERFVALGEARTALASAVLRTEPAQTISPLLAHYLDKRRAFIRYTHAFTAREPLAFFPINYHDWLADDPAFAATLALAQSDSDSNFSGSEVQGFGVSESAASRSTEAPINRHAEPPIDRTSDQPTSPPFSVSAFQHFRFSKNLLSHPTFAGAIQPGAHIAGLPYGIDLPAPWTSVVEPTEPFHAEVIQTNGASPVLRITGSLAATVSQRVPIKAGRLYYAAAAVRAQVPPTGMVMLALSWLDVKQHRIGSLVGMRLPEGHWPDWVTLQQGAEAPAGATFAEISVAVKRQFGSDWAEVGKFSLREFSAAEVQ